MSRAGGGSTSIKNNLQFGVDNKITSFSFVDLLFILNAFIPVVLDYTVPG